MATGRPPFPQTIPGMPGIPSGGLGGFPGGQNVSNYPIPPGMQVVPGMGAVPPGSLGALQQAQAQAMSALPKVAGANIAGYPHLGRGFGGKRVDIPTSLEVSRSLQVERRITNETVKQYHSKLGPPQRGEEYAAQALMSASQERIEHVEPWADALDEVDPRELAMNRFQARQLLLSEIFGPEPLSESRSDQA